MRKTLTLLLALLLALGTTALAAEKVPTALVMRTDGVTASVTVDEETTVLPLDKFSVEIALNTRKLLEFTIAAFDGQDKLAMVALQLSDDRLNLGFDGVDKTYEIEVPALAGADTSAAPELVRAVLPSLMGLKLPMIDAVPFPKADLVSLFKPYVVANEPDDGAGVTRFSISRGQISSLAAKLSEALKSAKIPGLDSVTSLLDDYGKLGVDLFCKGKITDAADRQSCQMEVFVDTGDGADTPTAMIQLNSAENQFVLTLGLPDDNGVYNLVTISLTSEPETNAMALTGEALHAFNGSLAISQSDGMQYVELDYNANPLEASGDFDLIYGNPDGLDLLSLLGKTGTTGEYEFTSTGAVSDDKQYIGNVVSKVRNGNTAAEVAVNFREALGSYGTGYNFSGEIVSINDMDPEEVAAAFQPLADYFARMVPEPAPSPEPEPAEEG